MLLMWAKPEHPEKSYTDDNMQTLHKKVLPSQELNPGPSRCEATALTPTPPCRHCDLAMNVMHNAVRKLVMPTGP